MSRLWDLGNGASYWAWSHQNYSTAIADARNKSNKVRPGELIMFHDRNFAKYPSRDDGKNTSIQLHLNDSYKLFNGPPGARRPAGRIGVDNPQIFNASSFLIGPRTKATFYKNSDYSSTIGHYPYPNRPAPDINKVGGVLDMRYLPWSGGDGPWDQSIKHSVGYNWEDKIKSIKLEWVDQASLKKDCCHNDISRGVDGGVCGEYWGGKNASVCDPYFPTTVAPTNTPIVTTVAPVTTTPVVTTTVAPTTNATDVTYVTPDVTPTVSAFTSTLAPIDDTTFTSTTDEDIEDEEKPKTTTTTTTLSSDDDDEDPLLPLWIVLGILAGITFIMFVIWLIKK